MRKDVFHSHVRFALEKEGWIITADPLDLTIGEVELFADLGAERLIAATRNNEKIAVEIKSFIGQSPVTEFHKAIGQYDNYMFSLEEIDPDRKMWLAIPEIAWNDFFQRPFIKKVIAAKKLNCLIFNHETQTIQQWIRH